MPPRENSQAPPWRPKKRAYTLTEAEPNEATEDGWQRTRAVRVAGGVGAEKQMIQRSDAIARNAGDTIAVKPLLLKLCFAAT